MNGNEVRWLNMKKKSIFLLIFPFSSVQFFPWMFSKVDELSFVFIYENRPSLFFSPDLTLSLCRCDPRGPQQDPSGHSAPCSVWARVSLCNSVLDVDFKADHRCAFHRLIYLCFKWDFWIWTLKCLFHCTFSNLHNLNCLTEESEYFYYVMFLGFMAPVKCSLCRHYSLLRHF